MANTEELLEAFRSPDWQVASAAAEQLPSVPGERVAHALADAQGGYPNFNAAINNYDHPLRS